MEKYLTVNKMLEYLLTTFQIVLFILLVVIIFRSKSSEKYAVTLSLPEWQQYVAEGNNTLYGDAIIPGGTMNLGWAGNGAVYRGHVYQGY